MWSDNVTFLLCGTTSVWWPDNWSIFMNIPGAFEWMELSLSSGYRSWKICLRSTLPWCCLLFLILHSAEFNLELNCEQTELYYNLQLLVCFFVSLNLWYLWLSKDYWWFWWLNINTMYHLWTVTLSIKSTPPSL